MLEDEKSIVHDKCEHEFRLKSVDIYKKPKLIA